MNQESPAEFRTVRAEAKASSILDEGQIDLRGHISKLWRGKWVILITAFFVSMAGFLVAAQFEPTYSASTKVMFDINDNPIIDPNQFFRNENSLFNEVEVLESTRLIERVIQKLDLTQNPEFNHELRSDEQGLGLLHGFKSGLTTFLQDIGIMAPPPPAPDADESASLVRRSVMAEVRSRLSLLPVPRTEVIEISVTTGDPRLSAAVANTFAQEYIVDQLDAKLEATREATTWLSDRVEELRVRVQSAEEDVEAERARLAAEAGQGLDITRAQLEALNARLSAARASLTIAVSTFERLSNAVDGDLDLGAVSEFRSSRLIQQFREDESEVLAQRTALEGRVAEDHPVRVRVEQQLSEVRANIRQEASRITEAARMDLLAQQQSVAELEVELRVLEEQALEQSQDAVRIRQLEREAEASRAVYENFLGRLKETSEQEAIQTADARVLSPAEIPLRPDTERTRRTQILSVVLGVVLGGCLVFLMDILNNTFRVPLQLEEMTGQPYLGGIPSAGRRLQRHDVVKNFKLNPKSALAEAVRSLRTSILFSRVDNPPKTVMFTSSVPGEGKSTTSMLVAMTSRQMGKSAIIIDCDLRLPSLARLLPENDGDAGLLSVLEGGTPLHEAIYRDKETGLDVLMTRPSEPRSNVNAADVLASRKFQEILNTLKQTYDLVILDTPPTLVVADARILGRFVDAVVYIVAWDRTPRGAVAEGLKELESSGAPVIGTSFTMLNETRAARYSYDGYSYYRGRYRDYYAS